MERHISLGSRLCCKVILGFETPGAFVEGSQAIGFAMVLDPETLKLVFVGALQGAQKPVPRPPQPKKTFA